MPEHVPNRGSLSQTSPCEVLSLLCRSGTTGVLVLEGGGVEKSIYLQKGKIVFAASGDPDDRLGEFLLTRGVIRREQLEQVSSKIRPGKRLGTVLVESGALPAADLPRWVREQVKEIVFSVFSWGDGAFRFEEGPLPSGEVITLKISTAEIFLTGLRRVQKWSVLRKGAGEIQIPYRLVPGFRDLLKGVQLGQEEESLLLLLESGENSMEQAATKSTLTTLLVYQLFFAFRVLGILVPMEATAGGTGAPREKEAPASPPGEPAPRSAAVPRPAAGVPTATTGDSPGPSPATGAILRPEDSPAPAGEGGREYKVIRIDESGLDGDGTHLIENLLATWGRKGYSLVGIVPARSPGLPHSSPSSYFIFGRG